MSDIHLTPELLVAALVLFQEAARRESLTAELIEEMISYLKRAEGIPI